MIDARLRRGRLTTRRTRLARSSPRNHKVTIAYRPAACRSHTFTITEPAAAVDRDPDLLLATEWGPVRLFRNTAGRLEDDTAAGNLSGRFGCTTPSPPAKSGLVVPGDAKGLAAADLNEYGWPDLVVAQNDDALLAFTNTPVPGRRMLTVRLHRPPRNPTAVGARITVQSTAAATLTAEIHAGSGYLSQSSPSRFFAAGEYESITITI